MEWHLQSILFLGVSPNIYEPQLTPISIAVLEYMDNSWYHYFFDRVYKQLLNFSDITTLGRWQTLYESIRVLFTLHPIQYVLHSDNPRKMKFVPNTSTVLSIAQKFVGGMA